MIWDVLLWHNYYDVVPRLLTLLVISSLMSHLSLYSMNFITTCKADQILSTPCHLPLENLQPLTKPSIEVTPPSPLTGSLPYFSHMGQCYISPVEAVLYPCCFCCPCAHCLPSLDPRPSPTLQEALSENVSPKFTNPHLWIGAFVLL